MIVAMIAGAILYAAGIVTGATFMMLLGAALRARRNEDV